MLLCGCPDDIDPTMINPKENSPIHSTCPPIMSTYDNEHVFSLDDQQQTSQLDRFTYFLLAKCHTIKQSNSTTSKNSTTNDLLDILLNTLLREMSSPTHRDMARFVTARFVRSVIRLFIILSLESLPDKSSSTSNQQLPSNTTIKRISATTVTGATITTSSNLSSSSSSTTLNGPQSILFQCKRIFQTLTLISINALVHTADLLLAPVRHGIAKPTAMFNLLSSHTDILQGLEEVFNIDSEYYRAYQENKTNQYPRPTETFFSNLTELNETDMDENTNLTNPMNINQTTNELNEDDDNNSDTQSQHETIHPITNSNLHEQQTTRESAGGLSDNESEMELELLAESDTDNESNRSAPNTNTHRTSATAGSENMALFSDDENSESDDADSVRSDSVLGEGDETSQPEPMIFDDARDALAAAAASSTTATTTTTTPNTVTNDRLVLLPSGNNPTPSNTQTANSTTASHLNVPRLNARTTMASSLFGDSHSRRQMAPVTTTSPSLNHSTSVPQQQTHVQQQQSQSTNTISVNTTNALLARAFAILLRQITDLLIRWPSMLSASSLYHDVLTTSSTTDEQNAFETIQVNERFLSNHYLYLNKF
jgi:E3 ubiquitin-protein ligase EDD1